MEPDLETLKLLAEQLDTDAETLLYGPEKNAERNVGAAQTLTRAEAAEAELARTREAAEAELARTKEAARKRLEQSESAAAEELARSESAARKLEQTVQSERREKRRMAVVIIAGAVLAAVLIRLLLVSVLGNLYLWDRAKIEVMVSSDPTRYTDYIGGAALADYRDKLDMDEGIFPETINGAKMSAEAFQMVYYDPWDPQYLCYLTMRYEEDAYRQELKRLAEYPSTEYLGYYGVTGFNEDYRPAAVYADPVNGFVYALDGGDGRIVYVEIIFCNYFMDLDYEQYIPAEYLPAGFDASEGNAYRAKMLGSVK